MSEEPDVKDQPNCEVEPRGLIASSVRWVGVLPVSGGFYFVVQYLAVYWAQKGGLAADRGSWMSIVASVVILFGATLLAVLAGAATAPKYRIVVGYILAFVFVVYHLVPLFDSWNVGDWTFRAGNIAAILGAIGGAEECHMSNRRRPAA